jgi:glycosyltransferase involved in cell wall biosynthesis
MKSKIKLSLVIPCYNEEKNIGEIVKRVRNFVKKVPMMELILVNNGSSDNTKEAIKKLSYSYSFIKLVNIKKNIGYGNGILKGILKSKGEFICWTHADLQTDPYDVFRAFQIMEKQDTPKDFFIKGKRYGRTIFNNFFTLGMSIFETIYLRKSLWDINSQPNFFHRSFLKYLKNPPKDFSFDLYVYWIAKEKKLKIIRFPVFFGKRKYGNSKWNTGISSRIKFIKRTIKFSKELKRIL